MTGLDPSRASKLALTVLGLLAWADALYFALDASPSRGHAERQAMALPAVGDAPDLAALAGAKRAPRRGGEFGPAKPDALRPSQRGLSWKQSRRKQVRRRLPGTPQDATRRPTWPWCVLPVSGLLVGLGAMLLWAA
ncbi:TPA: hypothetical protein ACOFDH_004364 [Stenotrophomonas maltophilia]